MISFHDQWNVSFLQALRGRITRGLATGVAHTKTTIAYIRDDETFVPKIAVVTVAGLGGLLVGHKGGAVRRTFYSTVAATVALSTCYPKQTTKLVDQVYHRIQDGTKIIFDSMSFLFVYLFLFLKRYLFGFVKEPVVVESKDRILHTTQRSNEPIVSVKGDYGQGVPADQQFYTTRDVTSEKKV